MPRKKKTGLDYYQVDTDIFQNRKVKRLLKTFGARGYLVYMYIITEIYRDKGYFLSWDEDTAFDVSDFLNLKESTVNEIVGYCCTVGLFNKELLTSENILTTKNIQEFWETVSKQAKRSVSKVRAEYSLLFGKGTLNTEDSTVNTEFIPVNLEDSTQSRVENSKEYNIKKANDVFLNEIRKDDYALYRENFYRNFKLQKGTLSKLLEEFNSHLISIEELKKNIKDYKIHFNNWMNRQESLKKLDQYKKNKEVNPTDNIPYAK